MCTKDWAIREVITDDDVAGTFTFLRAHEDYECSADLKASDIGKLWKNYLVEKRAILWWGGNGNSTEHAAWLNLRAGIPAPASGSIATNGLAVAEQIGAQIFIDGWALVAPGQPAMAAKLAKAAGSVSHNGECINAAVLWAAMEAEAFVSRDVDHLLDTCLTPGWRRSRRGPRLPISLLTSGAGIWLCPTGASAAKRSPTPTVTTNTAATAMSCRTTG